jgi:hypothetical protein
MARRKRRRRRSPTRPAPVPAREPEKSKDEIAREQLEPLHEGERPLAVTIGALIAAALGLSTVVLFGLGVDTGDSQPNGGATLLYAALMLVMAAGMWRARYWAVLGFEALLAILIVIWSLLLLKAESVLAVVVALAVVGGAGTMFWFLVKALARIQMPQRSPR